MPADDVTARLDALEQAREKLAPGPWRSGLGDFPSAIWRGDASVAIASRAANAALIVAEHGACGDLLAAVRRVLALHVPYSIYDHCGHDHSEVSGSENGVYEIEDVGYVCADGLQYVICDHCCAGGWGGQTEACIGDHEHGAGLPICPTVAAITDALSPVVEP